MRRSIARLLFTLTSFFGTLANPTAGRSEVVLTQISPKLSISGSLRLRGEFWNWFEPTGPQDNDYAFGAAVARGALQWKDELFEVMVEAESPSLFALPDNAIAPAPQGQLGLGATYFANNRSENDTNIFLRQGFIILKRAPVEGITLKGGRFEFSEGVEVMTKEPTLDWLKNLRISQRLIGPFNFSHVGRSFDGGTMGATYGPLNFTMLASHPTQGGFDLAGMKDMDEIDLLYTALNLTRPPFADNFDARFFYIYYKDDRGLLKSDNRPLPIRRQDRQPIRVNTEGGHAISVFPTSAGPIDFLAWGALQQGDWGFLDHDAWAWDLEMGWQPSMLPWKPWFRVGYGRTSGDDNPTDGDHDTFFQILPTARLYAYSTFYNLMNNEDGFLQLLLRPMPGVVSRTDLHFIRVSEPHDLWYQGSGATVSDRDVGFGFPGRPTLGNRDFFRVLETSLSYDFSKALNFTLYYGHVFGQSVVRALFENDQADFGYLEVTLKL